MNIDPNGLTVKRWCDEMVPMLAQYGQAPFLRDEADWQTWGQEVCKLPGLSGLNPPNPLFYTSFHEWAEQFNSAVPL